MGTKHEKLQRLHAAFGEDLPRRIAAIRARWSAVADTGEEAERNELQRLVHSIAGSAGTFGYQWLSVKARALEQILARLSPPQLATAAERLEVEDLLAAMDSAAQAPDAESRVATLQVATVPRRPERSRLVYVVEDDPLLAQEVAAQLAVFGWDVRTFADAALAKHALKQQRPAAMVLDVGLPEGPFAGTELMGNAREASAPHIPTVVISARWDWPTRLAAARSGAEAFVSKPFDSIAIAEQLERLMPIAGREPYRILIVDDAVELAEHFAEVLRQAGMEAGVVTDPANLLPALAEANYELILMDLYMPGCSGVDAARVVRQDPKFTGVPIVFLSTETARQAQLSAMQTGADDFLHKPIADAELVSAVTLRVERFRVLNSLITQDRLTGLLNHIAFKLQVEACLARARRSEAPLSFLMIDIDHFKNVNDTYGHLAGDRVIKSLARLLRQRLRESDLVGRYGGEEFAVLLPDTPIDIAVRVVGELREQFAGLRHHAGEHEFSCTFSAGGSSERPPMSMDKLIRTADAALYEAKRLGRNRICVA